jgi:hypothetical protein
MALVQGCLKHLAIYVVESHLPVPMGKMKLGFVIPDGLSLPFEALAPPRTQLYETVRIQSSSSS